MSEVENVESLKRRMPSDVWEYDVASTSSGLSVSVLEKGGEKGLRKHMNVSNVVAYSFPDHLKVDEPPSRGW